MKNVLKLRHAGDLAYTEEKDLTEIGMSRPEQKRLRREYGKYFPQSSFVVKVSIPRPLSVKEALWAA